MDAASANNIATPSILLIPAPNLVPQYSSYFVFRIPYSHTLAARHHNHVWTPLCTCT